MENIIKWGERTMVAFIILATILAIGPMPSSHAAERTVRVGIFNLGNFMSWNDQGQPQGYNIDYLEEIAEKTHWTYEYIKCDNWEQCKTKLAAGELDLIAPAQRTEKLLGQFSFGGVSMGIEAGALYALKDKDAYVFEDFDNLKNITFGVLANSSFKTYFVNTYGPEHGFTPKTVDYPNSTDLMAALKSGEVEAIATNIMFASDDVKLLGWYNPVPVYYIAKMGDTAILEELDTAMTELMVDNPSFNAQLEANYFPVYNNTELSADERDYIKSLQPITVGYEVDKAPVSYTDANGEFAGITRDVLDEVAQYTGVTFKYEALPATAVTTDYLKEHQIYVLSNVENNEMNKSIKQMHIGTPYLESEKVLVGKGDIKLEEESKLKIALSTGSGTLAKEIVKEYPNLEIQNYDSLKECFDAVEEGSVDATIQNRYVADTELENPKYDGMRVMPIQLISDQLCIATMELDDSATCKQLNNILFLSVMDKAVNQISNTKLNQIIINNASNSHYKWSILDFIGHYAGIMALVIIGVGIVIASLFYSSQLKARKNKELGQKNDQLADAVAQADRANTAKSEFLSRMSHEIRTPMNAIVGLTAIAKQHEDDPGKIDDYLTKIDTSSKVLLNIINDVLDMSAIESDKLKIGATQFDIKQVLTGISTIYYPQCTAKGIQFEIATDVENELLIGDSLRINQVLLNLVSNAYKFTPEGGTINIKVRENGGKNGLVFLEFKVSDTGCGMDEAMLGRLFKPFEQESADTAKKHGGSGLGMSIAKNLVEMMQGTIGVESVKGKGTTFTVELPFKLANEDNQASNSDVQALRLLVVDDDDSAREYAGIVLTRIGVGFDTADGGKDAIEKLNKARQEGKPYDVLLVDWKMPEMDGLELTRAVRKQEAEEGAKKTLIIIVSAYDLNEVEDDARLAGADHFVAKPLFQSTVFNVLMTLSGGQFKTEHDNEDKYDFTGCRVLLAEDNEINAEIATELLSMVNMKTDHAEDGQVALDLFTNSAPGTYDAILMDVQMPNLDGYEATRAIRNLKRPDAQTIPVLAMTANAFTADVSDALNAGMNSHIPKPIDTEVLYSTLAKWINKPTQDSVGKDD